MARYLIDQGADVNCKVWQSTALQVAAEHGHFSIVEMLITAGANINSMSGGFSALHVASMFGHMGVVKALLFAGADVHQQMISEITTTSKHWNHYITSHITPGMTALHAATTHGSTEVMRALLNAGAQVNDASARGSTITPLHLACVHGRPNVVAMLLDAGAWINAMDFRGLTPLDTLLGEIQQPYAATAVELLRNRGAKATCQHRIETMAGRLLLTRGGEKNVRHDFETHAQDDNHDGDDENESDLLHGVIDI